MHLMRCLIIGGSGRVGSQILAACAERRWPHLATYYRNTDRTMEPMDVRDADGVRELIADYQPEITFFTAPPSAGISDVAEAIVDVGGKLALISGDSIFGDCKSAMREEDKLKPMGSQAEAEASAELLLQTLLPNRHLILRTSQLYGDGKANDPSIEIAKVLRKKQDYFASNTQYRMPTYTPDFAEAALELAQHGQHGTFHVVGPERHTEFTFARLVAHVHGFDADLIQPTDEITATSASSVWLDRYKLRMLLGPQAIRPAADGLRAQRARRIPAPAVRVLQAA
jgi:dTDP-4-dehydrorhamnose reductase